MTATIEKQFAPSVEALKAELGEIELGVLTKFTLADAIREGATVSTQAHNWGYGNNACALSAGAISAAARGYVK